jgi:hypothetical protein
MASTIKKFICWTIFTPFISLKKIYGIWTCAYENAVINLLTFQQKIQNNIYIFWNAKWKRYL